MKEEKRQFPRYTAIPGMLYVFFHNGTRPWEIKDIGKGGLAFEYQPISGKEIKTESIEITKTCDVQCRLSNLPCKVTYDIAILSQDQGFRGTECRRRGLNYKNLTEKQNKNLETLLDNMLVFVKEEQPSLPSLIRKGLGPRFDQSLHRPIGGKI